MPELNARATAYIAALSSPQREICRAVRELILGRSPELREEFKWNAPVYYHAGRRICLVSAFRRHVTVELFYGAQLRDDRGLVEGVGKRTRHLKLASPVDVDAEYLVDLVRQSVRLARRGA